MSPRVSVIIPCYNEQSTIRLLLEALLEQTYPRAEMEVIIADGLSTDGTRDVIAAFQTEVPDLCVRVVENTRRVIPSGANRAMEAARGEILVRLDGHSMPYPDYIENSVKAHEQGRGENVGGVWEIRPGADTWIAHSIAAAAAHPLGVGDAFYRHTKRAAEVDTVPFGSFRRALIDRIGFFDESLLSNEDYEFNARVRLAGGRVWLDPSIRSIYFARSTLWELIRQYGRYGFWKWRMLRRYPGTLRWRQALPPLFVLSLVGLLVLSMFIPWTGLLLAGELFLYFSIMLLAGLQVAIREHKIYFVAGLPLAIAAMHIAWGSGFLWSILPSSSKQHG
jgi:cellulose synthase/poly-beta-1,6-N-acetylglucosamine synthase-like glycosyltransferase